MIHTVFQPFYYIGKVVEQDLMKQELVPYIESSYSTNPNNQPLQWSCKVHTSYEWTDSTLEKFKENYFSNITECFSEIGFPNCQIELMPAWFNLYRNGQWQEVHNHYSTNDVYFTAVHFLKFNPEVHSPLILVNSNKTLLQGFKLGESSQYNDYWKIKYPIYSEEGDIVIFPSTVDHQVFPQETDESRITISFNIKALNK